MSLIVASRVIGGWEQCNQTDCRMMYFRYAFGHKCYSVSDKIGTCPLCIHQKKIENGTLPKKDSDISKYVHHKSSDAKPESDSL